MNPAGRPAKDLSQSRKDAVLRAAREEFASNGYHATTVDSIARRAGVSKRTVYFWHADKAALFDACVLDGASSLSLPKLEVSDRWEEDLALFGKAMLHALSSDYAVGMIRLLTREGIDIATVAQTIAAGGGYLYAPLVDLLVSKGIEGDEAMTLAQLYIAMLMSDVQRRLLLGQATPSASEIDAFADIATRTFLGGISSRITTGD